MRLTRFGVLLLPLTLAACGSTPQTAGSYEVNGKRYQVYAEADGFTQTGMASWYGKAFHGKPTASGEIFNMYALTAAHTQLPLPSYVKVTRLDTADSVVVRVNDRGPFHGNRIIDLSYAAAKALGMERSGTAKVKIDVVNTHDAIEQQPSQPQPVAIRSAPYLQVGAFASEVNAMRRYDELHQELGYPVKVVLVRQANGGSLYRVVVGPFQTDKQQQIIVERLQRMGLRSKPVMP